MVRAYDGSYSYNDLNALLNLVGPDGGLQLGADREAVARYFESVVVPGTRQFGSQRERVDFLVANGYYEPDTFELYEWDFVEGLFEYAYSLNHRFDTFLGAFKFFTSYALKTFDGREFLETFTDRVVLTALYLADGVESEAHRMVRFMISGAMQPATPTFLNAGKKQRGELVSCFLLRVEDNLESIGKAISSALQLSKRGGGVALSLTNLREAGAPIKQIENQSSGVIPVMKLLEDSFSYANQLGARPGAGAVYLHAHHPDIMSFLDTKRENADEKTRIKTLSIGVVVPDVTFELAKRKEQMALFSPYDVERVYGVPFTEVSVSEKYEEMLQDDRIKKTFIDPRDFFMRVAELQFESGYPYIMFEDTVNRAHNLPGRITMSNLCSEIAQGSSPSTFHEDGSFDHVGEDISCNLASLNIAKAMDEKDLGSLVRSAVLGLTTVTDKSAINAVPSVKRGNDATHAIGLGQMNLHGYLGREKVMYGSPEALEFVSVYFAAVAYYAVKTSCDIAKERGETFEAFPASKYASGEYFDKYVSRDWLPESETVKNLFAGIQLPTRKDWEELKRDVMQHGMYHGYLQAIAPTGSISYINHSTSSLHPIPALIETRKEGKLGRVYVAPYGLRDDNQEFFKDAYETGPQAIIDTYARAQEHVDQSMSCTLFFKDTVNTRDLNRTYIAAWRAGLKTLYYSRIRQKALEGTEVEGCVSCYL